METTIYIFMRIGAEDHMRSLFNEGRIYMNTIQYFRDAERSTGRGDPAEGRSFLLNWPKGTFTIPEVSAQAFRYEHLQLHQSAYLDAGNAYCLYTLARHHTIGKTEFRPDTRNAKLGTHMVLIKQPGAFLDRVQRMLDRMKLRLDHGFVNYYNEKTYSGPLSVFDKPEDYAFQHEFRLFVPSGGQKALSFSIGSIADIAELHPIQGLSTFVATEKRKLA